MSTIHCSPGRASSGSTTSTWPAGEEARFEADMEALNALPVASRPRASSAIPDIRGFIGMVIDRGYAYQAGGSVFFDVSQFERFGSVGNYSREQMLEFARRARAATSTIRTSAILSTSSCGSRPPPTSRRGRRCGVPDARAGTSSAAPSRSASSARRSTCTAVAPTSSFRITSASGRSPKRRPVSPSSSTGCTRGWSPWTARRCPRVAATSCSSTPCARSGTPPPSG